MSNDRWLHLVDAHLLLQIFPGPVNDYDYQTVPFLPPLLASKLLVIVLGYTGSIKMAFELYGCHIAGKNVECILAW